MEEMLGNQGVTESNMMQYLGIIEQRTGEILQAYAASQQMTQAVETQVREYSSTLLHKPSHQNFKPPRLFCCCDVGDVGGQFRCSRAIPLT